jgi:hypothetical protein
MVKEYAEFEENEKGKEVETEVLVDIPENGDDLSSIVSSRTDQDNESSEYEETASS